MNLTPKKIVSEAKYILLESKVPEPELYAICIMVCTVQHIDRSFSKFYRLSANKFLSDGLIITILPHQTPQDCLEEFSKIIKEKYNG